MLGLPTIQNAGGGFTAPDWTSARTQQASGEYLPYGQNLTASADGYLVGYLGHNGDNNPALTIDGQFYFACFGQVEGAVALQIPVCIPLKKGTV